MVKVGRDDGQVHTLEGDSGRTRDPPLAVRFARQPVNRQVRDGHAGEDRLPVLAAVVVELFGEPAVEPGQASELRRLVHPARPPALVVHLLQRDEVRPGGFDDRRDPRKVDLAVGPLPVVDVVRQHPDRRGGRRGRPGPGDNGKRDERLQPHDESPRIVFSQERSRLEWLPRQGVVTVARSTCDAPRTRSASARPGSFRLRPGLQQAHRLDRFLYRLLLVELLHGQPGRVPRPQSGRLLPVPDRVRPPVLPLADLGGPISRATDRQTRTACEL